MGVVLILLAVLFLGSGWRMRGRLRALAVLPPSDEPAAPEHRFVAAPGVTLDEATCRAASAWARTHGLDVLDLVPADLPAIRAISFALIADPNRRRDRLARGVTAGHALLVSAGVAARAQIAAPADDVAFLRLAGSLKLYAPRTSGVVVAPWERAAPESLGRRGARLRAIVGPVAPGVLAFQFGVIAVIALGFAVSPVAAATALAAWHVQTVLAIAGSPLRSRDLVAITLLRGPAEVVLWCCTVFGRWREPGGDPVEARRPEYAALLARQSTFWEPRATTCPVCGAGDLVVHLRTTDLLQHKPGEFTLERCTACSHIFQNPRLSPAGLSFYYADFYDGLGEATMEGVLGQIGRHYLARAHMVVDAAGPPARWLDVGAGHGHFCAVARDVLPDTTFDGLDMSDAIDEAGRRGWVDTAWRGLFPDVAPRIAGSYDAVSMSHYLEHTTDPRRELAAARTALAPRGALLVEVPDPEFGLGRALGRYWLPWFQPQHLHLLSAANLERLLREAGFEPVAWHRGEAHGAFDFAAAVVLAIGAIAPEDAPWHPRHPLRPAWRRLVFTLGTPALIAAWTADQVAARFIRRGPHSNTYRVVARVRQDAAA